MNWNLITYLVLLFCFLTFVILAGVLHYRRRKAGRQISFQDRLILVGIFLVLGMSLPVISHLEIKETWLLQDFSGQIVEKRTTGNHALIEYTVASRDGGNFVILDELWKMKKFEVGDWVKKRRGEENAVRVKER